MHRAHKDTVTYVESELSNARQKKGLGDSSCVASSCQKVNKTEALEALVTFSEFMDQTAEHNRATHTEVNRSASPLQWKSANKSVNGNTTTEVQVTQTLQSGGDGQGHAKVLEKVKFVHFGTNSLK